MDVRLSSGEVVYRLLKGEDDPSSRSWQPKYGKALAAAKGIPELLRIGMSHYLTIGDAQAVNTQESRIAQVTLTTGRFYWARTGNVQGHIDVWGRSDEFPPLAQVVESQ